MATMNRFRQYLVAGVFTIFLIVPAVLRADCPEGVRTTTEAERREYMRTLNALKAVPSAPAGWQLQTPKSGSTEAPTSTCKGLKLTAEYEVTYVSIEQQQLNQQYNRESSARIAALRKLSPDEQKQVDDFNRQGRQLSAQAAVAKKNNNRTEADRLREQANQFYAKSRAVYQAHQDKIAPQIAAIADECSKYANPEVRVHLAVDDLPAAAGSGAEKVQIPGVPQAFFDRQKALVMSYGRDAAGRNIRVRLEGDRERVLTIARLFTESSLRTLATK
jgi:hypothetical protein